MLRLARGGVRWPLTLQRASRDAEDVAGADLPPRFESTAWDLAIATGTLAYLDSELAFALSRAYGMQAMTNGLGNGMREAMYLRTPTLDGDAFLAALRLYYQDLTGIEPGLIPVYDTLLVALDEALAK